MPRQAGSCRSCRTLCPWPSLQWRRVAQPLQCQAARRSCTARQPKPAAPCATTRGPSVVSWHTGQSRSYSPHQPSARRPPLRAARHAITRCALASMAHLAPAWLRFSAVAAGFECVQTSGTRSNPLLPRPCASAPPVLLPLARPVPAMRPVPASASAVSGSHGRPWSHGRHTMSRMASTANHGGLRSAVPRGCIAMNAQLVKEGHNTSIERTCHGRLRLPRHAAHVER
jgi:hypothetical protein